jgi:hypothetical protein
VADWHIGGGAAFTTTPDYTTIPVYDGVAPEMGPLKRGWWRRVRDAALADWSRSGLRFAVEEKVYDWTQPPPDATQDEIAANEKRLMAQFDRRSIVIKYEPGDGRSQGSYTADYTLPDGTVLASPHVGIATLMMGRLGTKNALRDNRNMTRGIVAHEIGHTLGFGHGGTGVMNIGYNLGGEEGHTTCSDEELQVAHDHYLGA